VNARARRPGGEFVHGLQFLCGGGQGGLDRGDLAEPALFPRLPEPVAQVGVDLFQPRLLGRVDPEEGASDTGIFMRAWRPEVAAAGPEGYLAQLEVGKELVPFGGGEFTVFFAGPFGAAAGDERPVMGDDVFGVDRLWRSRVSQLSECPSARRSSAVTTPSLPRCALREPGDRLDLLTDGSSIRRDRSRDVPGQTAAVRRSETLFRRRHDLVTCGFSPG
jgi:hypothetical protein